MNDPRTGEVTGPARWREFADQWRAAEDTGGMLTAEPTSGFARFRRRFRGQVPAMVSLAFLILLGLVAVFAPALAPYDPNSQDLGNVLATPGSDHWLGTDQSGRDVLSRLIDATRISLLAAVQAMGVACAIGVIPGLLAGFFGGWLDLAVMRVVEAAMSFPPLLLAIAIVGVLGPGLTSAMLAVGVAFSPRFARLVRGVTLSVREQTFVQAAISVGCSVPRILSRHVLPSVLPPLIVQVSLATGFAMLLEASLSFLGLGVTPPQASWGSMLGQSFRFVSRAPFLAVPPGIMLTLAVLAFNLLGDGLRDSIGRDVDGASDG